MTETCRFGVRREFNSGSPLCLEVFDRMTGTTVASGMSRVEAEAEARCRNDDTSAEPAELTALSARAAQALDEVREELAQADRMITEQQTRIGAAPQPTSRRHNRL